MKTAIIVTGLLRCIGFNQKIFQRLSEEYDVYVITNKSEEALCQYLSSNTKVFYIDDNDFYLKEQQQLLLLPEGGKLLQWQKLKYGVGCVIDHEDRKRFKYDQIFKLRTDLEFLENITFNDLDTLSNTLLMNTDYYFGGRRDIFLKAANFFEYIFDYYDSYNYKPFDYEAFVESDFECAKFQWLNYPFYLKTQFNTFIEFKKGILNSKYKSEFVKKSGAFSYRKNAKSIIFPSEPAFLHFLLRNNIRANAFPFRKINLINARNSNYSEILNNIYNSSYINSLDVQQTGLKNEAADFFRYYSMKFKEFDLDKSIGLIKVAKKIRPKGVNINTKLNHLKELKNNEKTNC